MALDTIAGAHHKLSDNVRSYILNKCGWSHSNSTSMPQTPQCIDHFSSPWENDRTVSGGASGVVELLPCGHVRKCPNIHGPDQRDQMLCEITREYLVYRRLGKQPHILEVVDFDPEYGIAFRYLSGGTMKAALKDENNKLDRTTRLRWAASVAVTLQVIHSHYILHSDVKPENIMLDDKLYPYVIDFSGSAIDFTQGWVGECTRCYMPRSKWCESSLEADLFALGSTIYNIMTGQAPYEDLDTEEVDRRYANGEFPNVDEILCGDIIRKCWKREMPSAQHVYLAILQHLPFHAALMHRITHSLKRKAYYAYEIWQSL